jgi:MFS family permease
MQEDVGNMSDVEWSAGISLFYVGYIISQVPANVIIAKGSPRVLLPCCMLAWSIVTICMVAMKSSWSFMLCRFLVGVTEGPFLPAVSLMTSSWYTKEESPLRLVHGESRTTSPGSLTMEKDGYMARWQYRLQCLLGTSCCCNPHQYG